MIKIDKSGRKKIHARKIDISIYGKSRIVPVLEKGTVITVPRSLVDYVATEWGLIRSRGLTINERAQALIRIAHPDHRETLMRQAVDAGFIPYRNAVGDKLPRGVINCRD
jgi:acyl-CoA hydrolase